MAQSQYGQISDLEALSITSADGSRFGNTAMNASLQAASSIADSYLSSQFTLPLKTSPQGWDMGLTLHVCNIAAYLLFNQFGFSPVSPGDDLIVKRYNDALDWLKQVRDGTVFPSYIDASPNPGLDEGGDWIVSDSPIGFTSRGVTNTGGDDWP